MTAVNLSKTNENYFEKRKEVLRPVVEANLSGRDERERKLI